MVIKVDKTTYAASGDALEEDAGMSGVSWCGPVSPMRQVFATHDPVG